MHKSVDDVTTALICEVDQFPFPRIFANELSHTEVLYLRSNNDDHDEWEITYQ